jgi:hypothetical protein
VIFTGLSRTIAAAPTDTVTVPTITMATVATRFFMLSTACAPMTVSPLTETTTATTSMAERR